MPENYLNKIKHEKEMKIFKFYRNMFLRLIAMVVIISCIISCAKQEVISDLDFQ